VDAGVGRKVRAWGAVVGVVPGKEGLMHVAESEDGYVEKVEANLQIGDKVKVQLIEVRGDGKLRLSRKALLPKPEGYEEPKRDRGGRGGGRGGDRRGGGRGGDRRGGSRCGDRRGGSRGGDRRRDD